MYVLMHKEMKKVHFFTTSNKRIFSVDISFFIPYILR